MNWDDFMDKIKKYTYEEMDDIFKNTIRANVSVLMNCDKSTLHPVLLAAFEKAAWTWEEYKMECEREDFINNQKKTPDERLIDDMLEISDERGISSMQGRVAICTELKNKYPKMYAGSRDIDMDYFDE